MATISHENAAILNVQSPTTQSAHEKQLFETFARLQDPVQLAQLLIQSCCNSACSNRSGGGGSSSVSSSPSPSLNTLSFRTVNDVAKELELQGELDGAAHHSDVNTSLASSCCRGNGGGVAPTSTCTRSSSDDFPSDVSALSSSKGSNQLRTNCSNVSDTTSMLEAAQSALRLAQEIVVCLQSECTKLHQINEKIDKSKMVHGVPLPKAPLKTHTNCFGCQRAFSRFHRSRYCGSCGFAFCHNCASHRQRLPRAFGYAEQQVQVCSKCVSWFQSALDGLFDPPKAVVKETRPRPIHGAAATPPPPSMMPSPPANGQDPSKSSSSPCSSLSGSCATPTSETAPLVASTPPPLRLSSDRAAIGPGARTGSEDTDNDSYRVKYCSSDDDDDDDQQQDEASAALANEGLMKSVSMEEIARSLEQTQTFASAPALDNLSLKPKLCRKKTRAASFDFVDLKGPASPSTFLHVDVKSPTSDASSVVSKENESDPSGASNATSTSATSSPCAGSPTSGEPCQLGESSTSVMDSQDHKHQHPHCHHHHHHHEQPHHDHDSGMKRTGSVSHTEPSLMLRKTCFDDTDIVLDKVGDRATSIDDSEGLISPTARYFQRFPVYDLCKGATKDQPATLKRVFMGFSKRNPLLDRYTVEVDGLRGVVLVKSVFMHRFWSFRCDSLRDMCQLNNPPSSLRCLVINCGEKDRILEWQFVSDKEREEFQRAIEETKRWLSSLRECSSEESIETKNGADRLTLTPTLTRCESGSTHGCPCEPPPSITTLVAAEPPSCPQIDEQRQSISSSDSKTFAASSPTQSLALRMRSIQWHLGEKEIEGVAWTTTLLVGPASTAPPEKLRDDASFIWARVRGIFSVTNYRVVFMPFEKGHVPFRPSSIDGSVAYIPLFAINSVQKMLLGGGGSTNAPTVTLGGVGGTALAASVIDVAASSSRSSRSNRYNNSGSNSQLLITCKDIRMMRLEIDGTPSVSGEKAQMLYTVIMKMADRCQRYVNAPKVLSSPGADTVDPKALKTNQPIQVVSGAFAMTFKGFLPLDDRQNGWDLFHDEQEFKRQVAPKRSAKKPVVDTWYVGKKFGSRSLTDNATATGSPSDDDVCPFFTLYQNDLGEICSSYPAMLLLPSCVRPSTVAKVASFRAKNRLPVITWFHRRNRCVLTRSSQPLLGNFMKLVSNPAALSDQSLVGVYRRLPEIIKNHDFNASSSRPIYIFDARKQKASAGNRLMGKGGVETSQDYPGAVICHLNIANMYKMQSSFQALMKLTLPGGAANDEKSWLSSIESTRWLEHVRLVLEGALKIARVLELEGSSALVHCSDGWDRTSQVVSLAQLMIDPYYRTIEGFAVLVEKDWCAFGHKFAERLGGDRNKDPNRAKSSPVMLQFLDCVWQIWRQFHAAFEFNERFLLHLANATTSGLYGTFLYDSRLQRVTNQIESTTVSVWTPVLQNRDHFSNPHYTPWDSPTWPWTGCQMVRLWEGFFFQWHPRYFDCGWISTLVHYGPVPEEEVVLTEEEQKRMASSGVSAGSRKPSLGGLPVPSVVVHGTPPSYTSRYHQNQQSPPPMAAAATSKRNFLGL